MWWSKKTINDEHKKNNLLGKPFLSWRISQIYNQGVCLYFYYAFIIEGLENPHIIYTNIEEKCRQSILDNGGTISHHHGIGKIRNKFVKQVFNERSIKLMKSIKKDLDPNNILGSSNGIISNNIN